jgi:hypothetical protein
MTPAPSTTRKASLAVLVCIAFQGGLGFLEAQSGLEVEWRRGPTLTQVATTWWWHSSVVAGLFLFALLARTVSQPRTRLVLLSSVSLVGICVFFLSAWAAWLPLNGKRFLGMPNATEVLRRDAPSDAKAPNSSPDTG